jgi:hypothetical protein
VGHRRLRGDASENPRRVKLLSLTPIGPADGGLRLFGHRPFRRLTARLQGPKLCLSPQPHRVRHELRPPALATPARHPGSGRPPGRRIAPSLHARGVGRQWCIAEPGVTPGTKSVRAGGKNASHTPIYHPDEKRSATPPLLARRPQRRRTLLPPNPTGRRRFRYAQRRKLGPCAGREDGRHYTIADGEAV